MVCPWLFCLKFWDTRGFQQPKDISNTFRIEQKKTQISQNCNLCACLGSNQGHLLYKSSALPLSYRRRHCNFNRGRLEDQVCYSFALWATSASTTLTSRPYFNLDNSLISSATLGFSSFFSAAKSRVKSIEKDITGSPLTIVLIYVLNRSTLIRSASVKVG